MSAAPQQKPGIKVKLSVLKGPHSGQVFELNKPVFTIGRGPENDIVLLDDPLVSRSHAQLSVVDRDLEISNLSSKNAVIVGGESVQKWKIVNNSSFTIGDSELIVEYDLGPAATAAGVSASAAISITNVAPASIAKKKPADVLQLKPKIPQKSDAASVPAPISSQSLSTYQQAIYPLSKMGGAYTSQTKSATYSSEPSAMKLYLIMAIIIGGFYYYFSEPSKKGKVKRAAPTLRYEDEVKVKMASKKEIDLEVERETRSRERSKSPQAFRIEESFVRGMRDFQLGNYTRAQEFFQLVLNLDSDHVLAKRYLYLSKVRFDELVQEKLMLGESYFKKHNFRMCESLYRQVMDMLNGKNSEQKFQLASKKSRECELAAEGIR